MDEVCDICGHKGFTNALIDCSECSVASVHQYCLGIPPGRIDDTFCWVCEYCSLPMESESCRKFGGAFSLGVSQSCSGDLKLESRSEIVALPEQLEPLCATSNLSQKLEAPISSFMEHPNSITRGVILIVSPSGEVFIDEEKSSYEFLYVASLAGHIVDMTKRFKKSITYDVKRDSSPLGTVENYVSSAGTIELEEHKLQSLTEVNARLSKSANATGITGCTNSVVDGCEKDDVPFLSKLDGFENKGESGSLRESFNYLEENEVNAHIVDSKAEVRTTHSIGNSMEDFRRETRKRTLEPEVEVIQRKKGTICKVEEDAEASSSEPVGNSNEKHELIKQKINKCKTEFDSNKELSFGTTLGLKQRLVRNRIVTMLLNAGWTVEYRLRPKGTKDKVYVNPQGHAYWSIPRAYHTTMY